MSLFSQFTSFDWDKANQNKNWHTHKVAWWECEEIFFNQPLYIYHDQPHSQKEERYYALGQTGKGRLLFAVFTRRGTKIRIISARDMHKKERLLYHEKVKTDTKI